MAEVKTDLPIGPYGIPLAKDAAELLKKKLAGIDNEYKEQFTTRLKKAIAAGEEQFPFDVNGRANLPESFVNALTSSGYTVDKEYYRDRDGSTFINVRI